MNILINNIMIITLFIILLFLFRRKEKIKKIKKRDKIDIVYTWVDSSDKKWQKLKQKYYNK